MRYTLIFVLTLTGLSACNHEASFFGKNRKKSSEPVLCATVGDKTCDPSCEPSGTCELKDIDPVNDPKVPPLTAEPEELPAIDPDSKVPAEAPEPEGPAVSPEPEVPAVNSDPQLPLPVANPDPEITPTTSVILPVPAPTCPAGQACEPVETQRWVGFGFEDGPDLGDKDYNDSILCFGGAFHIDYGNGAIRALQDQSVRARVKRNSSVPQNISIVILASDGSERWHWLSSDLRRSEMVELDLNFNAGDQLEVHFDVTYSWLSRDYHVTAEAPSQRVLVEADRCRLGGS